MMIIPNSTEVPISEDEKDILQEVMNISFGQVAAELAEIIDVLVVLSVPNVTVVPGKDFQNYLSKKLKLSPPFNVIEQSFSGKLSGIAFLVFSSESGKNMVAILDEEGGEDGIQGIDQLEKETLMEIGNMLTGACVGKIAEQLDEVVYYTLPRVILNSSSSLIDLVDKDSVVILVKTEFQFADNDVSGFLFLITNQDSFQWLKEALHRYIEQF